MGFVFFAFLLFGFCFVVGLFFLHFHKVLKKFITKIIIIIYKLNTLESFYYKEKDFTTILVFFFVVFITVLEK
jgi:hypothetical protein